MIVWSLFIIDLMGLFFYTKIGSIISIGDLPTTNIIEPKKNVSSTGVLFFRMLVGQVQSPRDQIFSFIFYTRDIILMSNDNQASKC